MTAKRFPTLRAQWLGREMRKYRINANLTLVDAGQYLQRDQATISRLENGTVPGRVADVMALLNYYGVDDPTVRADLEQISRDAWQRGWWDGFVKYAPTWILDLAWMEGRAHRIRSFDPLVLHGILQTEDYARALMTASNIELDDDEIERFVEIRMKRRQVLNGESPTKFETIIDESALRRNLGGRKVMKAQLAHLCSLAEHSSVQIRMLPFDIVEHPGPDGSFALLELPDPYPQVGHIDTVAGNLWVEGDEAEKVAALYDRLESAALSPADSATRITQLAEGRA